MNEQIDLEDAIAAIPPKCPTVREFAMAEGQPEWRVREAVRKGLLEVDDRERPMRITGGEMALTVQEWQKAIEPALKAIRRSQIGWSDGGKQVSILAGSRVHVFKLALTRGGAEVQAAQIQALGALRLEAAE